MPLTKKGSEILGAMRKQYGSKKGESVFYASKNAGKITGVDAEGDTIKLTIPLLIKLMEYAREDASNDKDLHVIVEELYDKSKDGARTLGIADYTGDTGVDTKDIIVTATKPKRLSPPTGPKPVIKNAIVTNRGSPADIARIKRKEPLPPSNTPPTWNARGQKGKPPVNDNWKATYDRLVARAHDAWPDAPQAKPNMRERFQKSVGTDAFPDSPPARPQGKNNPLIGTILDAGVKGMKWGHHGTPSPSTHAYSAGKPTRPLTGEERLAQTKTGSQAWRQEVMEQNAAKRRAAHGNDAFPNSPAPRTPGFKHKVFGHVFNKGSKDNKVFFKGAVRDAMRRGMTACDAIGTALDSMKARTTADAIMRNFKR